MIPPLTEQWAATYFEVLAGVLIFALGIAALILQIALPSYLRTLAKRRHVWWTYALMVLFVFAIAAFFLWLLHPTADAPLEDSAALVAHLLVTGTLAFIVLASLIFLRQIDRTVLVSSLKHECRHDLFWKRGFDETLGTLIDIGQQAHAGYETADVIKELVTLARFVLGIERDTSRCSVRRWIMNRLHVIRQYLLRLRFHYDGDDLKPILTGFEAVLLWGNETGSPENFKAVGETLKSLLEHLQKQGNGPTPDTIYLLKVAETLTINAQRLFPQDGQLHGVYFNLFEVANDAVLTRIRAPFLYRIGEAALAAGSPRLCIRALNTLLPADGSALTGEEGSGAELLGLMAHLWSCGNGGGKVFIRRRLLPHLAFNPDLDGCLEHAIEYHLSVNNLDTAGLLVEARTHCFQ
ncbi:MAG: hypothetical protein Kow00124_30110 [Anaerolineae bacterium]